MLFWATLIVWVIGILLILSAMLMNHANFRTEFVVHLDWSMIAE